MLLRLNVFDAKNAVRGPVKLKLDFQTRNWSVQEDVRQIWTQVGYSNSGSFEEKTWGVIWLWDQVPGQSRQNTVILHSAPTGESDATRTSGQGRLFAPKDATFKDGKVDWNVDATPAAATPITQTAPALSSVRQEALQHLDKILPALYGSFKWKSNPFHSEKKSGGYTNCVEFPAYLIWLMKLKKLLPGYPPPTTAGWTPADGKKKPQPGDIYILCKTTVRDHTNAHVGVIYSTDWNNSGGTLWRTGDWGQGGGWNGQLVERRYDPKADTLTGDPKSPYPEARALFGWVNLDEYAAASPGKK